MDRKEFIKSCCYSCLGGTALMTLLQSCAGSHYFARSTLENNRVIINKNEFVKIEKERTVSRKFILVRTENFGYPIGVYKLSEENYSALLMQCTHKGCELQPEGDYLVCPCHGSEFTAEGTVHNPPAERNLQTFKVSTDHENIYIHL
jgi:cytochrome b6-f complex iron-sulfur subunit